MQNYIKKLKTLLFVVAVNAICNSYGMDQPIQQPKLNTISLALSPDQINLPLPKNLAKLTLTRDWTSNQNWTSDKINQFIQKNLKSLINLETLNLAFNKLTELPENILLLKKLQTLNLRRNELTELPENFTQLENLKELDLAYNNLTKMPGNIFLLKKLQALNLRRNEITELPLTIRKLKKMQSLNIGKKRLSKKANNLMRPFFTLELPSQTYSHKLSKYKLSSTTDQNVTRRLLESLYPLTEDLFSQK